ncbi:hypothetical protein MPNT_240005 [Candidatus Methylacidithermus pantelleriae]|uniref:Uncharacterized protein n=1 Tax=Candidatus Methylacidithermus pantelleriae TaxID=2744239 RepID=A0A8J2FSQ0_9BACT|nr:hypothetical protein MPNT_240005 [Candidatus Methylacidithermus pantelleriae]
MAWMMCPGGGKVMHRLRNASGHVRLHGFPGKTANRLDNKLGQLVSIVVVNRVGFPSETKRRQTLRWKKRAIPLRSGVFKGC